MFRDPESMTKYHPLPFFQLQLSENLCKNEQVRFPASYDVIRGRTGTVETPSGDAPPTKYRLNQRHCWQEQSTLTCSDQCHSNIFLLVLLHGYQARWVVLPSRTASVGLRGVCHTNVS